MDILVFSFLGEEASNKVVREVVGLGIHGGACGWVVGGADLGWREWGSMVPREPRKRLLECHVIWISGLIGLPSHLPQAATYSGLYYSFTIGINLLHILSDYFVLFLAVTDSGPPHPIK